MTENATRGTLLMMVGIPASGKSSWIKSNCDHSWTKISPDAVLEEKYNYEWTPERAAEAWAESFQAYGAVLLSGGKVVWDKTNLAGNKVASGVYIVLLTNDDASENAVTKIAIVN